MMDELLKKVIDQTGLGPDQAKAAVDSVLGFLKDKLPAPLASGLSSFIGGGTSGGESGVEGLASQATAKLGGLFGK